MRRAWLAVLAALLPLAAATPAGAQRGVGGPIYERNIDALIEGAEPGALRMLIGASRSRSARYGDLTRALLAGEEDTDRLRAYRIKMMAALTWDQQITSTLGAFARLG